tara:strand:- start:784 stop:1197 length:414 start_codon:yes stop_codon:yes gene_type:complete
MKHGIIKKDKMYLVKKVYVGWDLVPANSKKEAKEIIDEHSYITEIYEDGEVSKHYLTYEDVGWIKIKVKKMMSKMHRAIQKQMQLADSQYRKKLPTSYEVTKEIGAWVDMKHSVVGEVDIEGSNELNKYPIDTTNIN